MGVEALAEAADDGSAAELVELLAAHRRAMAGDPSEPLTWTAHEASVLEVLWHSVSGAKLAHEGGGAWTSDHVKPRSKRDGGQRVAQWARAVRWALAVQLPGGDARAAQVCKAAMLAGCGAALQGALPVELRTNLPPEAEEALRSTKAAGAQPAALTAAGHVADCTKLPATFKTWQQEQLPHAGLRGEVSLVDTPEVCAEIRRRIGAALISHELAYDGQCGDKPLLVGMDCEWDDMSGEDSPPATVQIAAEMGTEVTPHSWVVDCQAPGVNE
eukprot:gene7689-9152_t